MSTFASRIYHSLDRVEAHLKDAVEEGAVDEIDDDLQVADEMLADLRKTIDRIKGLDRR